MKGFAAVLIILLIIIVFLLLLLWMQHSGNSIGDVIDSFYEPANSQYRVIRNITIG